MAHSSKDEYNQYMREYMKTRYHRRRKAALALLGDKCAKCDTTDGLEIDHKEPSKKGFNIGARLASCSNVDWMLELKKCQLLCEFHHKEKHKSQAPHGTPQRYWRKCRCVPCKAAMSAYNREARRKRLS